MVSQLLQAVTTDLLHTASSESFFKEKRSVKALGEYPTALTEYLKKVSAEDFVSEVQTLLSLLGSGTSVFVGVSDLRAQKNGLFEAFLDTLQQDLAAWMRAPKGTSRFANELKALTTGEGLSARYRRILIRESQMLLQEARGIAPTEVQVAMEVDEALLETMQSGAQGLTQVTVNPDLLGGIRQFKDGSMQDASWRARLTRVLSVIS